jgi:hypothetical protein
VTLAPACVNGHSDLDTYWPGGKSWKNYNLPKIKHFYVLIFFGKRRLLFMKLHDFHL